VFDRARPVVEAFGKKIVHAGPVGSGDALKAVNNALLAVHILSTAEGLAVLVKAGVDPKVALDVINASSGRSNTSENLIPQRVLTRAFPRTFRLALLEKDIGIAAVMADDLDAHTPLISLAAARFHAARAKLGEEADHVEAVKMIEEENNVEIRQR
jgi:3-hydroxyisobutyrate dehydrogenase